jgi:CRP-like cAMP-binding protein
MEDFSRADWSRGRGVFRVGLCGRSQIITGLPTRSATIRVTSAASLPVLRGDDLKRLILDYPIIPIRLCNVLSQRIRILHQRLAAYEGP